MCTAAKKEVLMYRENWEMSPSTSRRDEFEVEDLQNSQKTEIKAEQRAVAVTGGESKVTGFGGEGCRQLNGRW